MQYREGPGFVALTGSGPDGDLLLDGTCAVAGGVDALALDSHVVRR
jgi:hypothetical protein